MLHELVLVSELSSPHPPYEKNASFVLVGLRRSTEQVGLYPEAQGPPVGTSYHDVFNTNTVARGSLPSVSPLVWPDRHAFHYQGQHQSEHTERQSIFLFSSRSKKKGFV